MPAVNVCLCQAKTDRTKHRKKFINAILIGLDSTKFRNLVLRLCFLPEMEHVPFHFISFPKRRDCHYSNVWQQAG